MRKRALWMVGLWAAVGSACGPAPGDPDKIAEAFQRALGNGNSIEAYALLSKEDQSLKSPSEFRDWMMRRGWTIERRKETAEGFTVEVVSLKHDQNQAQVVLKHTAPPFPALYASLKKDKAPVSAAEFMAEAQRTATGQPAVKTETLKLIKEAPGWRVALNFREEEKYRELLKSAQEEEGRHEWAKAAALYEKIYRWDPQFENVAKRLPVVRAQLTAEREMKAYIEQNLHLQEVGIEVLALGKRHLFGYIANQGSRTVTECGLVIQYIDDKGVVMGETARYAVMESDVSRQLAQPIEPGARVRINIDVEGSAPVGWGTGIRATIAQIKLK